MSQSQSEGTLEIDFAYAKALGLRNGQRVNTGSVKVSSELSEKQVAASLVPEPAHITTLHVTPKTPDDWEILSIHASYLEDYLLSQVKVVQKNQTLSIWIETQAMIKLTVDRIEPDLDYGLLSRTEIVVTPIVRKSVRNAPSEKEAPKSRLGLSLRSIPLELVQIISQSPLSVVINSNSPHIPYMYLKSHYRNSTTVPGVFVRVSTSSQIPANHVAISSYIRNLLHLRPIDRIKLLQPRTNDLTQVARIKVHFFATSSIPKGAAGVEDVKSADQVKVLIAEIRSQISLWPVITSNLVVELESGQKVTLCFGGGCTLENPDSPSKQRYIILSQREANELPIEVSSKLVNVDDRPLYVLQQS